MVGVPCDAGSAPDGFVSRGQSVTLCEKPRFSYPREDYYDVNMDVSIRV